MAGDSDWGQGAATWDDNDNKATWGEAIRLKPSGPSGSGKKNRDVVPDEDGWGVGVDPWSTADEASVAGSNRDQLIGFDSDGDVESANGSNHPNDPDHTPRGSSPDVQAATAGPQSALPEREYFDWADEPQDEVSPMSFPEGDNSGANVANPATSAGWTKAKKKKWNSPFSKDDGTQGMPQRGTTWNGGGRGRGRGKGKARASDVPGTTDVSVSWRSTARPPSGSPETSNDKGKGKPDSINRQPEELPVFNDVSEWMDTAVTEWGTSAGATWDAPTPSDSW